MSPESVILTRNQRSILHSMVSGAVLIRRQLTGRYALSSHPEKLFLGRTFYHLWRNDLIESRYIGHHTHYIISEIGRKTLNPSGGSNVS